MKLKDARARAMESSKANGGAVQHVCAIYEYNFEKDEYFLNQERYYVSDWSDGTTVESYVNNSRIS